MVNNKQLLQNEKGQMAIFVALVFQVLFVLFAMSINVGLVVYDKVNLQNSVDLAAYYGAQKQAEMLNVIAHQNYQIRKAWKLLSWRYRVLGQFGLGAEAQSSYSYTHPARLSDTASLINEEIFESIDYGSPEQREYPTTCIGYGGALRTWNPSATGTNLCKKRNFRISSLIKASEKQNFGLLTSSWSKIVIDSVAIESGAIKKNCAQTVAYSYLYTAGAIILFRKEQKARKDLMYSLLYNMAGSNGDFVDIDGGSVKQGVETMVQKNLTFGNTEPKIQYFNSLQHSDGLSIDNYFSDIKIEPSFLYVDASNNDSCEMKAQLADYLPENQLAYNQVNAFDQQAGGGISAFTGRTQPTSPYQYSLGLEKNPWSWIYTGVKATTKTRPLFFPFGEPLTLTAVAFAKPFGGRMGPWYKRGWSPGSMYSDSGALVDGLVPYKPNEVNVGQGGQIENLNHRHFPNYSRYPGDEFGLRSKLSLAAIKEIKNIKNLSPAQHINAALLWEDEKDSVIWDVKNNDPNFAARKAEIVAMSPDLFDATYYSVEPKYSKVYLNKLKQNRQKIMRPGAKVQNVNLVPILNDLGSRDTNDGPVVDAIESIRNYNDSKLQEAYYFLKDPKHLLTAWLHGSKYLNFTEENYKEKFAKCDSEGWAKSLDSDYVTPGVCQYNGGRTGYSVKLISSKLFFNKSLKLGGEGVAAGPINNPPKGFF